VQIDIQFQRFLGVRLVPDAEFVFVQRSSSKSSSVTAADAKRGVVARIISSTGVFRFSYNRIFNVSS
jgi:hypothetical protein